MTTYKRGLYVKSYCFFETVAKRFRNYKLRNRLPALKAQAVHHLESKEERVKAASRLQMFFKIDVFVKASQYSLENP